MAALRHDAPRQTLSCCIHLADMSDKNSLYLAPAFRQRMMRRVNKPVYVEREPSTLATAQPQSVEHSQWEVNDMSGEHPYDRIKREKDAKAASVAAASRAQHQRDEATRSRAIGGWRDHDEVELNEALGMWNAKLERDAMPGRFKYEPLPQPGGDLYRGQVVFWNNSTGAHAYLEIRVTIDGGVALAIRGSRSFGTYAAGQVNRSTWDTILEPLFGAVI
jgi:hypothetical protein